MRRFTEEWRVNPVDEKEMWSRYPMARSESLRHIAVEHGILDWSEGVTGVTLETHELARREALVLLGVNRDIQRFP